MHPSRISLHSRRVFSGIQPTGILHLGNYIGAVQNWLKLQDTECPKPSNNNNIVIDRSRCIFSIVDLHAMTMPYNPAQLESQVVFMTSTLLACGLDPNRILLYTQSHVREHTELAWLLSCITPLGWLQRMTQFKAK